MNLAGYIRVSTEQQVDAYGKAVQRKYISEWAVLNSHTIVEWFEEDAVSGKADSAERPVLSGILGRADEFDGIVFFDATRIARRSFMQETLLNLIWATGLRVFTTMTGEMSVDEDDPTKILIRQVIAAVAEFDHRSIVKKLHAARKLKSAAGGFAGGTPRFGMRVIGHGKQSELVVDEREALAIDQIMECRYQNMSYQQIADRMNQFGVGTKTGKTWYPTQVQRVIQRFENG